MLLATIARHGEDKSSSQFSSQVERQPTWAMLQSRLWKSQERNGETWEWEWEGVSLSLPNIGTRAVQVPHEGFHRKESCSVTSPLIGNCNYHLIVLLRWCQMEEESSGNKWQVERSSSCNIRIITLQTNFLLNWFFEWRKFSAIIQYLIK